jgi:hypothetical protein
MRVLDLGTGGGNVALLAARMVGESGSVVSVEGDLAVLSCICPSAPRRCTPPPCCCPGGEVCCHEPAFHMGAAAPQPPLVQRVTRRSRRRSGSPAPTRTSACACTASSRTPACRLRRCSGETVLACGPEAPTWAWGNIARGMAPVMERLGVDGAGEARSESLDERMLAELCEQDAVLMSPLMVGAWTRVPTV